jgi:hypothetical protein
MEDFITFDQFDLGPGKEIKIMMGLNSQPEISIPCFFLGAQAQFKLLHWQTQSYSQHKAFEEIYESLDGLVDSFVEVYQGKYGRVKVNGESIQLSNINEIKLGEFLEDICKYLLCIKDYLNEERDTDLLNIKDEMLAALNKLKYLLTLK